MFKPHYFLIFFNHVPSLDPSIFKEGGVNFLITFLGSGDLKSLKSAWKYGPWAGLLKRQGGGLALLLLNFFKVYHFYIKKVFYSLENCVIHFKKNYFFLPQQFYEKKSF